MEFIPKSAGVTIRLLTIDWKINVATPMEMEAMTMQSRVGKRRLKIYLNRLGFSGWELISR